MVLTPGPSWAFGSVSHPCSQERACLRLWEISKLPPFAVDWRAWFPSHGPLDGAASCPPSMEAPPQRRGGGQRARKKGDVLYDLALEDTPHFCYILFVAQTNPDTVWGGNVNTRRQAGIGVSLEAGHLLGEQLALPCS